MPWQSLMRMFPHPRHPSHPGVKSDANNVRHGQTSLQNLPLDDLSKGHTMCFYYFLLFVTIFVLLHENSKRHFLVLFATIFALFSDHVNHSVENSAICALFSEHVNRSAAGTD